MTTKELKHEANLERWAQAIQERRNSGMPVKTWCKTNGIAETTYYRWEKAVRTKEQSLEKETLKVSFAEISAQRKHRETEQVATLHYENIRVDIYPGMDDETLELIMRVMRRC